MMNQHETPEYFRLKACYGEAVAARYQSLICSPQYRPAEECQTSEPGFNENLPSCVNVAGVRLSSYKYKKILGAITIFPSLRSNNYRFSLTPRTLFATAKELGWCYNVKLERWEFSDHNLKEAGERVQND